MPTLDPTQASWRKSRRNSANGACVEVAHLGHALAVRDSKDPHGPVLVIGKDPHGPVLVIGKDQWASFIARLRSAP